MNFRRVWKQQMSIVCGILAKMEKTFTRVQMVTVTGEASVEITRCNARSINDDSVIA